MSPSPILSMKREVYIEHSLAQPLNFRILYKYLYKSRIIYNALDYSREMILDTLL